MGSHPPAGAGALLSPLFLPRKGILTAALLASSILPQSLVINLQPGLQEVEIHIVLERAVCLVYYYYCYYYYYLEKTKCFL